ncbi:MAG: transketolase C-terminal domain-containing protein [Bdellovibrionota bacterium]
MADKATRDAFGEALKALGAKNPKIVALDADLSCSTKSAIFGKAFPERFFQMGIAESNMVGTAAGLAMGGYIPFICSFGCFLTGRYETIRMSVGYCEANVKIVGTHAGIGIGEDGNSQMGLEDVALMRAIPGMTVFQPCDEFSTHAAVEYAATHDGPFYLRLTRQKLPNLYKDNQVFQSGRGIILKEGKKLALLGTGATVIEALRASEELANYNPWVIDIHTLKPIDRALIRTLATSCDHIVTIEDHSLIGGLGSAVAEVLAEVPESKAQLIRIGIEAFGESGDPAELYEKYGLSAPQIVQKLKSKLPQV